jgi:hypothetical protein
VTAEQSGGQRGRDAPPLLLEAARRLDPLDAAMARQTYLEAIAAAMFAGRLCTEPDVHAMAPALSSHRSFSFRERRELFLEASHRIEMQEESPAHAGYADRGQFGERRCLRQANHIHRAVDFRDEVAQRIHLP